MSYYLGFFRLLIIFFSLRWIVKESIMRVIRIYILMDDQKLCIYTPWKFGQNNNRPMFKYTMSTILHRLFLLLDLMVKDRRVIKSLQYIYDRRLSLFFFFAINLHISSFNNPNLDQCRAHKSISTPYKFVLCISSILHFTPSVFFLLLLLLLLSHVLMINHTYVHSLFSLSMTRTYHTKYQTCIWREKNTAQEREREVCICNSRKWEGLISSVCSRRWRCWMTFSHMVSIYWQA